MAQHLELQCIARWAAPARARPLRIGSIINPPAVNSGLDLPEQCKIGAHFPGRIAKLKIGLDQKMVASVVPGRGKPAAKPGIAESQTQEGQPTHDVQAKSDSH